MPSAQINGPIIKDIEIKRSLVKEITDAMEKAYGNPRGSFVVNINEYPSNNVGVGGVLVVDLKTDQ